MAAVDAREALRFVAAGMAATVGNLAAVALARAVLPYDRALLCGIAVGMTLSFVLTKFFAFRTRATSRTGGEMARFLLVYGVGVLLYYGAAVQVRGGLVRLGIVPVAADMAGVLAGAGLMVVSGYFGHRFFTYRTGQGASR